MPEESRRYAVNLPFRKVLEMFFGGDEGAFKAFARRRWDHPVFSQFTQWRRRGVPDHVVASILHHIWKLDKEGLDAKPESAGSGVGDAID